LDEEVKALMDERAQHVKELLTRNRHLLEKIGRRLLEVETMDSEEFYALVGEGGTPPDESFRSTEIGV